MQRGDGEVASTTNIKCHKRYRSTLMPNKDKIILEQDKEEEILEMRTRNMLLK